MLEIREKYHPTASKVGAITVKASSFAYSIAGKPEPRTRLEGKFSLRYCAALALIEGSAVESDFTDESVNAPEIRGLMSKINVIEDESLAATEAGIHIKMADGAEIRERLELLGKEAAVSIAEWGSMLETKSSDLLGAAFSSERTGKIIDAIKGLEAIDNIKDVVEFM